MRAVRYAIEKERREGKGKRKVNSGLLQRELLDIDSYASCVRSTAS